VWFGCNGGVPTRRTAWAVVLVAAFAAGCSDDDTSAPTTAVVPTTLGTLASSVAPTPATSPPSTESSGPAGRACERFPADGAGSLAAIAREPLGTAMAQVPGLSALVAAIEAAGLLPALDGPGPLTIFAPVNAAFEAIPPGELDTLLTDSAALNSLLLYHAVADELTRAEIVDVGEVATIEGQPVSFVERGDDVSINDGQATVICSDIVTANGVIHMIDAVLTPLGASGPSTTAG
jgi:uncharacterized surface protein with fasciclin (FAS1) repeats